VVRERLGIDRASCRVETVDSPVGPGNVLMIAIESDGGPEVVTGFGQKGVTAERVASDACSEATAYLAAGVPVGMHLADQLSIPTAIAGGGGFRSLKPTARTTTDAEVIRRFVDVPIVFEHEHGDVWCVRVGSLFEDRHR
jgi:RNA 3'-terminal phosphate cyclase (ATP)